MDQLGPNALGEALEPGRVADVYLGLLLPPGPAGEPEAGTVLVVAPAALLHPGVPQPAGSLLYELLTGHPEREPGELVFVADLACELRAWPTDTWTAVGVDPDQITQAVVGCWRDGEVSGLQVDDLGFEEARSLAQPAMTYVRGQLRGRLAARLARAHRRWLHPTSRRKPGDRFPQHLAAGDIGRGSVSVGVRKLDSMLDGRSGSVRQWLRKHRARSHTGGRGGYAGRTLAKLIAHGGGRGLREQRFWAVSSRTHTRVGMSAGLPKAPTGVHTGGAVWETARTSIRAAALAADTGIRR